MAAERESTDRYMAAYLADHVGDQFIGRITGVTRFGLFVELEPSGGDGLIPISDIGNDYYTHDADHHRLVGERYGEEFRLGDKLDVRLTEANKFTGGLRLELIDDDTRPGAGKQKAHYRKRGEQKGHKNRRRR